MSDHVHSAVRDRGLLIQMNRPSKKNALTLSMYLAMVDAIKRAEEDPAIRAILIAGTDDCFTAGNDLVDFMQQPPTGADSPVFQFLRALVSARKPVVAAVSGVAVGIGTTMLLHCDLVYASPNARFQLPFVDLGLVPEAGSSLILPRLKGHRRAAELLLLGETIDATTAHEWGIVNAVVPAGDLMDTAWGAVRSLAAKPPEAVRLSKSLMRRGDAEAVEEAIRAESGLFIERLRSPEAREAIAAFLERRPADFSRFS